MSQEPRSSLEVFISYASENKPWADAACAVLERRRIRCWIAPRDILPGTEWGAAIIGGIDACRVMVLIFSSHANSSSQVRREVERAISKGLSILPFRVEDVRPAGAMEYALSNTHWLDAFTPPVERQMEALAAAVQSLLGTGRSARGASSSYTSPGEMLTEPPVRTARGAEQPPPLWDRGRGRWLALAIGVLLLAAGLAVGTMLNRDRAGERLSQPDSPAGKTNALTPATVDTRNPTAVASTGPLVTPGAPASVEPKIRGGALFSPAARVGKTLYISGKGDNRPNAEFPERVENCLNEIRKTLQSVGLDMRHVVKSFVYLEDRAKYAELNPHYAKFFSEDPPARTMLGVARVPGGQQLEITCIAYTDLAEKKRIGDSPAGLPFSPGILAGDTLYISGKGYQRAGGVRPETFEEQFRQAMKNVETTLHQAGVDFRHVVMSHVFLDNYENLGVANKVYSEFFENGNEPACATVFVDWMPGGLHVEITCIATTDLASRKVVRPDSLKHLSIEGAVTASPAVWAGDTLYISALSGSQTQGGVTAGNLAEQVHQMARNHITVLETAGLTVENIASGCVYLRDMKDFEPMNDIYRQHFSGAVAVRTCVMPNSSYERNDVLVRASFIAARRR